MVTQVSWMFWRFKGSGITYVKVCSGTINCEDKPVNLLHILTKLPDKLSSIRIISSFYKNSGYFLFNLCNKNAFPIIFISKCTNPLSI